MTDRQKSTAATETKALLIRVPGGMVRALDRVTASQGELSRSVTIRRALAEFIDRQAPAAKAPAR